MAKKAQHQRHTAGIVERGWRKNCRIDRTRILERLKLADRLAHDRRRAQP